MTLKSQLCLTHVHPVQTWEVWTQCLQLLYSVQLLPLYIIFWPTPGGHAWHKPQSTAVFNFFKASLCHPRVKIICFQEFFTICQS